MKHELLSPAGNLSSLLAAINAGADAVYAGTDRFSARAYADNMSSEEFIFGIRSAHLADVKVYLALNTLIGTNEYEDAYKCIRPLYESGLDGIIVQDLGLIPMLNPSENCRRIYRKGYKNKGVLFCNGLETSDLDFYPFPICGNG